MCPIGVTQLRCRFGAVRGQLLQKIFLILSLKTFFPCHFLVATIERIILLYSCQLQRCTRKTTADTHVHNWVEQCRSFQMESLNIVEKMLKHVGRECKGKFMIFEHVCKFKWMCKTERTHVQLHIAVGIVNFSFLPCSILSATNWKRSNICVFGAI